MGKISPQDRMDEKTKDFRKKYKLYNNRKEII
jgi:hypothetical protein